MVNTGVSFCSSHIFYQSERGLCVRDSLAQDRVIRFSFIETIYHSTKATACDSARCNALLQCSAGSECTTAFLRVLDNRCELLAFEDRRDKVALHYRIPFPQLSHYRSDLPAQCNREYSLTRCSIWARISPIFCTIFGHLSSGRFRCAMLELPLHVDPSISTDHRLCHRFLSYPAPPS